MSRFWEQGLSFLYSSGASDLGDLINLCGNGGGLCIWFILTHCTLLRLWVSFILKGREWGISEGPGVSGKRGEQFHKEGGPDHSGCGAFAPWIVALVGGK